MNEGEYNTFHAYCDIFIIKKRNNNKNKDTNRVHKMPKISKHNIML